MYYIGDVTLYISMTFKSKLLTKLSKIDPMIILFIRTIPLPIILVMLVCSLSGSFWIKFIVCLVFGFDIMFGIWTFLGDNSDRDP